MLPHAPTLSDATHVQKGSGKSRFDNPDHLNISLGVIIEFDHHSGVFLTNGEPAKFHIHTLLRTPNGGDYGTALRSLIPGVEQEFLWEG